MALSANSPVVLTVGSIVAIVAFGMGVQSYVIAYDDLKKQVIRLEDESQRMYEEQKKTNEELIKIVNQTSIDVASIKTSIEYLKKN